MPEVAMRLSILTTGGTIDKTYNEYDGNLQNSRTVLEEILGGLRLPDMFVRHVEVLHKDSLEMTAEDRQLILRSVRTALPNSDAVIIVHGTDTLSETGEFLHKELPDLKIPIVLTGAMRPYEFRDSDAPQNVTEALFAVSLLNPGVYAVMHNRALRFPGVRKDREGLTFLRTPGKSKQ
jgi:L-asparaginase